MNILNWFKPSPKSLLKKKKDAEILEQLRHVLNLLSVTGEV